jgi:DNA uptake protein ComE-like DNA-binding protein
MWERFWREYLGYPKKERRGIYVLLTILMLVAFYNIIDKQLWSTDLVLPTITVSPFDDAYKGTTAIAGEKNKKYFVKRLSEEPICIDTASITALAAIGFSKYQATIIFNYIQKGAAIYTVKDLAKIYSIDQKTIDLTASKIIFSDSSNRKSHSKSKPLFVKKITKKVELNSCDSASLDSVFYMSSHLAGRIINYRNRIGGFFELAQIQLIYGIDSTVYAKIANHLSLDTTNIKRIDLNSVSLERLALHPYIGYKLAKVMVNYRMQHGAFKSKSDLKKIILINEEIFRKIERYILIQ